MAMLAIAIGADAISNQERREAIIDGLFDLPSKFVLSFFFWSHLKLGYCCM